MQPLHTNAAPLIVFLSQSVYFSLDDAPSGGLGGWHTLLHIAQLCFLLKSTLVAAWLIS